MSVSGKLGLGNIKNQIAHNQFLSALGNKDLKVLQDVITSEKVSMASSMNASKDTEKVAEAVKSWGWGEGDDLKDVCAVAGSLLHQHAGATATAASYQTKIREQFKRIRTREEELDEIRRRRKALSGKIESAEKKLAKMNSENKNLPQQTQLLESFRQQAADLDVEIVNSEAMIWDYKRSTTKTALGYKFCSLVEFAEKVSIIGEMGKLLIEEIQLDPSIPGQPHPPYNGAEQTRKILEQAEKSLSEVTFGPLPLTSRPPELDVSANDFAPRIESRDVRFDDTVDSGLNRDIGLDPHNDYDEPPPPLEEAQKPWTHQNNNSYLSVDSDFRTSTNPNAYPNDSYTSANAYSSFDGLSPPAPNLNQKPRSVDNISIGAAPEGASHQSPSANSLRRARGDKTQYDYDTSAFFSRNHAGGFNDAPVLNSFTPAPVLGTKPPMSVSAPGSALGTPLNGSSVNVNELHDNPNEPPLLDNSAGGYDEAYEQPKEIQFEKRHDSLHDKNYETPAEVRFDVPSAGHYEEPADVHYNKPKEVHYEEPHYEQVQKPQETMTGIGLLNTSPSPPPQLPGFEEVADEIPRYQLNDNSYTHPNEAPQAPPKEDIYGGIEDEHPTSPLPNPYDTPFNQVAEPPSHETFDNENNPQFSFSNNHAMANQPRMLTAGAFKRSNKQESPTGSDTTPPLNINKRDTSYVNDDAPVGPPPPRGDSLT